MEEDGSTHDRRNYWNAAGRWIVFLLASTSITSLLADFYHVCSMRVFTPFVFVPAMILLAALAIADGARGDGQLCRAVWMGLGSGLLAAVAYDIFRLPFVFAKQWGIDSIVPPMNLFKVFPGFGAMILGQPADQPNYSTATQVIGWLYHFSNGAAFGAMYMAMIGDALRRHWLWAVVFAVGLELGMLFTPYPAVFNIPVTPRFVAVTMAAHAIFGVGLGLMTRWLAKRAASRQ